MSRLMRDNARMIRLLSNASPAKRCELLKNSPKQLIFALSDGAANIIKGRIRVPRHRLNKLKRYKRQLKGLACIRTTLKKRKKILRSQRGGFLGTLAAALVPTIASLIVN